MHMHYHSFIFSVMCKCSYLNEEQLKTRKNKAVLPPSGSSSQGTTPSKHKSSRSSSTSQREISTTFFSSARSSRRQSQALEDRSSVAWIAKDEAGRSGGATPRILFPQLKRGKLKRRVTIGSTLSTSSGSGDAEEPDWPPFADEDYIVFCFEEDGAFHVMEDGPKLECEEHGDLKNASSDEKKDVNHLKLVNRRDCLLPNKEAEEDMSSSQLSPKLHQDGIHINDQLLANSKIIMLGNELSESMECRNGSVESTDSSSQLENEEQFQNEHESEVEQALFPWSLISQDGIIDDNALLAVRRDCVLPSTDVPDEEMTLSPNSKLGVIIRIDELLKGDNDVSSIESDQSSGFSGLDMQGDEDNQLEGNEELASESAKSSISHKSNSSSNSFEFPVLELEWIGSPAAWPRSERVHSRKHKPRPACIRCCKF